MCDSPPQTGTSGDFNKRFAKARRILNELQVFAGYSINSPLTMGRTSKQFGYENITDAIEKVKSKKKEGQQPIVVTENQQKSINDAATQVLNRFYNIKIQLIKDDLTWAASDTKLSSKDKLDHIFDIIENTKCYKLAGKDVAMVFDFPEKMGRMNADVANREINIRSIIVGDFESEYLKRPNGDPLWKHISDIRSKYNKVKDKIPEELKSNATKTRKRLVEMEVNSFYSQRIQQQKTNAEKEKLFYSHVDRAMQYGYYDLVQTLLRDSRSAKYTIIDSNGNLTKGMIEKTGAENNPRTQNAYYRQLQGLYLTKIQASQKEIETRKYLWTFSAFEYSDCDSANPAERPGIYRYLKIMKDNVAEYNALPDYVKNSSSASKLKMEVHTKFLTEKDEEYKRKCKFAKDKRDGKTSQVSFKLKDFENGKMRNWKEDDVKLQDSEKSPSQKFWEKVNKDDAEASINDRTQVFTRMANRKQAEENKKDRKYVDKAVKEDQPLIDKFDATKKRLLEEVEKAEVAFQDKLNIYTETATEYYGSKVGGKGKLYKEIEGILKGKKSKYDSAMSDYKAATGDRSTAIQLYRTELSKWRQEEMEANTAFENAVSEWKKENLRQADEYASTINDEKNMELGYFVDFISKSTEVMNPVDKYMSIYENDELNSEDRGVYSLLQKYYMSSSSEPQKLDPIRKFKYSPASWTKHTDLLFVDDAHYCSCFEENDPEKPGKCGSAISPLGPVNLSYVETQERSDQVSFNCVYEKSFTKFADKGTSSSEKTPLPNYNKEDFLSLFGMYDSLPFVCCISPKLCAYPVTDTVFPNNGLFVSASDDHPRFILPVCSVENVLTVNDNWQKTYNNNNNKKWMSFSYQKTLKDTTTIQPNYQGKSEANKNWTRFVNNKLRLVDYYIKNGPTSDSQKVMMSVDNVFSRYNHSLHDRIEMNLKSSSGDGSRKRGFDIINLFQKNVYGGYYDAHLLQKYTSIPYLIDSSQDYNGVLLSLRRPTSAFGYGIAPQDLNSFMKKVFDTLLPSSDSLNRNDEISTVGIFNFKSDSKLSCPSAIYNFIYHRTTPQAIWYPHYIKKGRDGMFDDSEVDPKILALRVNKDDPDSNVSSFFHTAEQENRKIHKYSISQPLTTPVLFHSNVGGNNKTSDECITSVDFMFYSSFYYSRLGQILINKYRSEKVGQWTRELLTSSLYSKIETTRYGSMTNYSLPDPNKTKDQNRVTQLLTAIRYGGDAHRTIVYSNPGNYTMRIMVPSHFQLTGGRKNFQIYINQKAVIESDRVIGSVTSVKHPSFGTISIYEVTVPIEMFLSVGHNTIGVTAKNTTSNSGGATAFFAIVLGYGFLYPLNKSDASIPYGTNLRDGNDKKKNWDLWDTCVHPICISSTQNWKVFMQSVVSEPLGCFHDKNRGPLVDTDNASEINTQTIKQGLTSPYTCMQGLPNFYKANRRFFSKYNFMTDDKKTIFANPSERVSGIMISFSNTLFTDGRKDSKLIGNTKYPDFDNLDLMVSNVKVFLKSKPSVNIIERNARIHKDRLIITNETLMKEETHVLKENMYLDDDDTKDADKLDVALSNVDPCGNVTYSTTKVDAYSARRGNNPIHFDYSLSNRDTIKRNFHTSLKSIPNVLNTDTHNEGSYTSYRSENKNIIFKNGVVEDQFCESGIINMDCNALTSKTGPGTTIEYSNTTRDKFIFVGFTLPSEGDIPLNSISKVEVSSPESFGPLFKYLSVSFLRLPQIAQTSNSSLENMRQAYIKNFMDMKTYRSSMRNPLVVKQLGRFFYAQNGDTRITYNISTPEKVNKIFITKLYPDKNEYLKNLGKLPTLVLPASQDKIKQIEKPSLYDKNAEWNKDVNLRTSDAYQNLKDKSDDLTKAAEDLMGKYNFLDIKDEDQNIVLKYANRVKERKELLIKKFKEMIEGKKEVEKKIRENHSLFKDEKVIKTNMRMNKILYYVFTVIAVILFTILVLYYYNPENFDIFTTIKGISYFVIFVCFLMVVWYIGNSATFGLWISLMVVIGFVVISNYTQSFKNQEELVNSTISKVQEGVSTLGK